MAIGAVAMFVIGLLAPVQMTARASEDQRQANRCEKAPDPAQAHGLQAACAPGGSGGGSAKGDFNGDGFGDLAVGVPFEDVGSTQDAGAVHIIYGTADGLAKPGNVVLHQGVPGVEGSIGLHNYYGWSVVAGHFNDDVYSDLAVGVSGEDLGGLSSVGAVNVLYGSAAGIRTDNDEIWDFQDLPGTMKTAAGTDSAFWGYSLAWADFNGDGIGDLAIGMLRAGANDRDKGAVVIVYGTESGLGLFGVNELVADVPNDGWGAVLSAGDYDGDGFGDLAIGNPGHEVTFVTPFDSGRVMIFLGEEVGLARDNLSFVTPDDPQQDARFGSALASGDFNGDLRDDLAVGMPRKDAVVSGTTRADAGAVTVFFGDVLAFFADDTSLSQLAAAETGDLFGFALAAADFNGDGRDDLAVGVPGEDTGSILAAGIAQVFPGSGSGPSTSNSEVWHQDTAGIVDAAEAGDQFGFALTAWNFGKGGQADLAVGVPFEDNGTTFRDSGLVNVIYGSIAGLTEVGDQRWRQSDLAGDGEESGDQFGRALY